MNTISDRLSEGFKGDRVIWFVVALLSIFSVLSIYSSVGSLAYQRRAGNTEYYLLKQLGFLAGCILVMYRFHKINYMRFSRVAVVGLMVAIPLLVYTLVDGVEIRDAKRWLTVPIVGMSFQTSDFAKLALILYLARILSLPRKEGTDIAFWPVFLPVLTVCGLIAPSDLSTAMILFATSLLMMFIGKVEMKNVWSMLLFGLGLFAILVILGDAFPAIRVDTWIERVSDFLAGNDSDLTSQVVQSKIAIAKGGWFGLGPGNGNQSNFIPHAYADFIYSIIIEEYGLIGGLVVLILYLTLFFRCVRMVTRCPKAFGAMMAVGISLSLVIQAMAHMAVAVNLMPVTGLTLPLISMGGTSLLFTSISLGIILSVSKYLEEQQEIADSLNTETA